MSKRIFIGYNNIVSAGTTLRQGFASLGQRADFYSNERTKHLYDYNDADRPIEIRFPKNRLFAYFKLLFHLFKLIISYDYFIFLQLSGNLLEHYRDVRILKFFGKKTMLILCGCDARIPESVESYKWNPCSECSLEYKGYVGCVIEQKKKKLKAAQNVFSIIASPDECSGFLSKPYFTFYFPIDLSDYTPSYPGITEPFVIVHAPSHHHVKGTRYINAAVENLKCRLPFIEYICISKVPRHTVLSTLQKAHLVIDQMLVGFYGVLAVEAMALGRPVICYIRPDIWNHLKDECPIINANPDNLSEILFSSINNKETLKDLGLRSRSFVEKFHESSRVAQSLISQFNSLKSKP
ncbi:MAG: hypothetical protein RLZZ46_447 [Bacteroidota bacterium]